MMNVDFNELIGKTASESPVFAGRDFGGICGCGYKRSQIIEREEYFPSVDKYLRYRIYSPIFNQFAIIAEDTTKKKLSGKGACRCQDKFGFGDWGLMFFLGLGFEH